MTPRQARWLNIAVIAVYALIVFVVAFRHEAWFDETDAWLIARDASLLEMIRLTPYVGVPVLWFLAMMSAAKLGLPILSMALINAGIAVAAIAVFMCRAPLPLLAKIAFVFGFYALYEYAVIARPYALMMLMLFIVASFHADRLRWPIRYGMAIALLCHVTVHAAMAAAVLGLLFCIDVLREPSIETPSCRRGWIGVGIALLSGITLLIYMWPPAQDASLAGTFVLRNPNAFDTVGSALFYHPGRSLMLSAVSLQLTLVLLPLLVLALLDRPRALVFYCLTMLGFAYVFYFKWAQAPRHAGLVLLIIITAWWIVLSDTPVKYDPRLSRLIHYARRGALGIILIGLCMSVPIGLSWAYADFRSPFSPAREMADWIQSHAPGNDLIIADAFGATVLGHLEPTRRMWFGNRNAFGSYHPWTDSAGASMVTTPWLTIVERAEKAVPRPQVALLLLSTPVQDPEALGYMKLYETRSKPIGYYYESQTYYLYRRTDGSPASLPASAPAVPR